MKLVRDRIPELAAASGQPGGYHLADPDEYSRRLRDKLLEEAHEATTATSPAALLEELGDVLQVLYALASQAGHSPAEIECARARKARTHGAYARRIAWQPAAPQLAGPGPGRARSPPPQLSEPMFGNRIDVRRRAYVVKVLTLKERRGVEGGGGEPPPRWPASSSP